MIPILAVLGGIGGTGLLLIASPRVWPRREAPPRARSSRITARLARAGLPPISPVVFVLASALLGGVAGALVVAATGLPVVAGLAAVIATAGPWVLLGARARSRVRTARALWPEVVDHLVSAIRVGVPLPDAIAGLAQHAPGPVKPGFVRFEESWRRTGTVGPALDAAKTWFGDPTADRIVEVLRMAREVGGTELPSVLRDLAAHLRHDIAVRAELEARQGWVTNAAKLGLAAPWIVLALLATRPEAAAAYATPAGTALIAGAAVVTTVAYRVMLAIARLPEDRRWFA